MYDSKPYTTQYVSDWMWPCGTTCTAKSGRVLPRDVSTERVSFWEPTARRQRIYIYIYIYRERERDVCVYICIYVYTYTLYIYIYTHVYTHIHIYCLCIYIYVYTYMYVMIYVYTMLRASGSDQRLRERPTNGMKPRLSKYMELCVEPQ